MAKKSIRILVENDKVQETIASLNKKMNQMKMFWNIKVVPVDGEVTRLIIG